jgi:hypothetical protein
MNAHKLVIDPEVIEEDYRTAMKYEQAVRQSKMLMYQMTRITQTKGCLRHDDRLDALAMGVRYFTDQMARDEEMGIEEIKQDALDLELEKYMRNAVDPLGRRPHSVGGSGGSGEERKTWISSYL